MMLGDTPPPPLSAALRTFKELGLWFLCLKSLWGLSSEGETILSSQWTFCFLCLCDATRTTAPLSHSSEIFPWDTGKWVPTWRWLGVLDVNVFPSQVSPILESFCKADRCQVPQGWNYTAFSFPAPSHFNPWLPSLSSTRTPVFSCAIPRSLLTPATLGPLPAWHESDPLSRIWALTGKAAGKMQCYRRWPSFLVS